MQSSVNGSSFTVAEPNLMRAVVWALQVCKLPSSQDYVKRPGIGSRRFAIVSKTIKMYGLGMHSFPL